MKTIFLMCMTVGALLMSAQVAVAAQLTVNAAAQAVGVGDSFVVRVALDAQGENINALAGRLVYPRDVLALRDVRDGTSLFSLWLERAHDEMDGIHFAGVVPGGFAGSDGVVFDLVFDAVGTGDVHVQAVDMQALLNDGKGTSASLTISAPVFVVAAEGTGARVAFAHESDTMPPEDFTPSIESDAAIFDGRAFVSFVTQDKGSGIDHYEVAEKTGFRTSRNGYARLPWRVANSPYLLEDQAQRSFVYVKAVDRAGHERVAVLSPIHAPFYYNLRTMVAILIGVLFALGAILYAYHRRHNLFP